MKHAPENRADRRGQLDERLAAIRTRLIELQQRAAQGPVTPIQWQQRVEAAQHHAAAAQAAAIQQLTYSAASFRHAAEAHDRAAAEHERAASSGTSQSYDHRRQAAIHRAAAINDRQRTEQVQSLLSTAINASRPAA